MANEGREEEACREVLVVVAVRVVCVGGVRGAVQDSRGVADRVAKERTRGHDSHVADGNKTGREGTLVEKQHRVVLEHFQPDGGLELASDDLELGRHGDAQIRVIDDGRVGGARRSSPEFRQDQETEDPVEAPLENKAGPTDYQRVVVGNARMVGKETAIQLDEAVKLDEGPGIANN